MFQVELLQLETTVLLLITLMSMHAGGFSGTPAGCCVMTSDGLAITVRPPGRVLLAASVWVLTCGKGMRI